MKTYKGMIVWLILMIIIAGCSPHIYFQPEFEKSNQVFMENVIKNMNLDKSMLYKIRSNETVAVKSIEKDITLDEAHISMIEDNLISQLIDEGYSVLERDENAINQMIQEKMKDRFSVYGKRDTIVPFLIETQLAPADYTLSYRILELGLIYRDIPENDTLINREGLVKLALRLQNNETSEILYSKNVQSTLIDSIENEFINDYAGFHYTNFPYKYPMQPKESVGPTLAIGSESKSSKTNYFYITFPRAGLGIVNRMSYSETYLSYGLQIGGGNKYQRVFLDGLGIGDKSLNIMLVYEMLINTPSPVFIPISVGAGFSAVASEGASVSIRAGSGLGFHLNDNVDLTIEAGTSILPTMSFFGNIKFGYKIFI